MSWAGRAALNLLPLSREQSDLKTALREWRYTGNMYDLGVANETCGLCDHPDIRYQFEIGNLITGQTLLIGSECINRFGIAATDEEGRTLSAVETRKRVDRDRRRLVEDARQRRAINALVALAHEDTEFDIESFITYLRDRGAFTPKQLCLLLWRFDKHRVQYKAHDFKVVIRRTREKQQLLELPDWQIERLWPCLSSSQRKFLNRRA